ncbi:hypothetical protein E4U39_005540 [Claviceps sp. Clav50 group G5]|nr:hypothetical protein E4U39_005540 [Claviceps sp. Clav50 group G5]
MTRASSRSDLAADVVAWSGELWIASSVAADVLQQGSKRLESQNTLLVRGKERKVGRDKMSAEAYFTTAPNRVGPGTTVATLKESALAPGEDAQVAKIEREKIVRKARSSRGKDKGERLGTWTTKENGGEISE